MDIGEVGSHDRKWTPLRVEESVGIHH
ncbi:uncharacterized protein G2W53_031451 [Senna tora]|uniref:Uncharacterized protein n=1 Tax=Senna tora TaxID=362788 RepID=A0A834T990_9FABA|nr:uncharacterized protein G2W53_031451 [Senna tora]